MYLQANCRNIRKKSKFEKYVADSLHNINASIAEHYGGQYMTVLYSDLIKPAKAETRTGKEIIDNIRTKLQNIEEHNGRTNFEGRTDAR